MSPDPDLNKTTARPKKNEVIVKGKSVSRGLAFGKVFCLHGRERQFFKTSLKISEIDREVRRLKKAFKKASDQLLKLSKPDPKKSSVSGLDIFESQFLMLADGSLLAKTEAYLIENRVNAEWAVKHVFDEYVIRFKAIDDLHIREKYVDIDDIAERILSLLSGTSRSRLRIAKNSIVSAKDLHPSTLIELNGNYPVGLISEHGGWTSHTFILAREAGIPSVTGLRNIMRRLENGDDIIVDGYAGRVIVNPSKETLSKYKNAQKNTDANAGIQQKPSSAPVKTLDNHEIIIRANADSPAIAAKAKKIGAKGVGLYRSEYLFSRYGHYPTENQQFEEYKKLGIAAGKESVKIRTFDLSASQTLENREERELNPALGLRGIRLSLRYPKEFKTQLRALLRASSSTNIDIVLPMISGISDIREVRRILKTERDSLIRKKIEVGSPKLGIMVEVPSTLFILDQLMHEVDLICLGTNDLSQYLLATDRDNETVAPWYRTLHPAVIKAIKMVVDACSKADKQLIFCGEMSGSPFYAPLLLGLGAVEFSMNPNSIPRVRTVLEGIAFEEAAQLATELDRCSTAQEIEALTTKVLSTKWSHLYPSDFLATRGF